MFPLFVSLIVATAPLAPNEPRFGGAVELYACDFTQEVDANFDAWPDHWVRQRGPGYPHYVKIELEPDVQAPAGGALRFDMNGGGAAITAPPTPATSRHGYVVEALVNIEQLVHDEVFLSLSLLDGEQQPIARYRSPALRETAGWQKLRLGPIYSDDPRVQAATVGLHVEPTVEDDLSGTVRFADLWLGQLPHMRLSSSAPYNLYDDPAAIELRADITGLPHEQFAADWELLDPLGRRIQWDAQSVTPQRMSETVSAAPDVAGESGTPASPASESNAAPPNYRDSLAWQPSVRRGGFFRARLTVRDLRDGHQFARTMRLAVVEPLSVAAGRSPFGWTLPDGAAEVPLADLPDLLHRAGVGHIKYPLWFAEDDEPTIRALTSLGERLAVQRIELTGLLNDPPPAVREQFTTTDELTAADVFAGSVDRWYPHLESVLTQFLIRTRSWQIGDDRDLSLAELEDPTAVVAAVKQQMDVLGQDLDVGIAWSWHRDFANLQDVPWRFLALGAEPSLNAHELRAYLEQAPGHHAARWVALEPLDGRRYDLATRMTDLIQRMLAAKIAGAAAFHPDPFDPHTGLLEPSGAPRELLLCWRTTALLLSGSQHLGSMRLPGGSQGEVFLRDGQAMLAVWADSPRQEQLYLGDAAEHVSAWGVTSRLVESAGRQTFQVDRVPSFLIGLDPSVAQWRLACELAAGHIPSIFGRPLPLAVNVHNTFGQGVAGTVRVVPPASWRVEPRELELKLPVDSIGQLPLTVTLPLEANSGPQQLELQFDVVADRRYQFSTHLPLEVGDGLVTVELSSFLSEDDRLVVEQRTINRGQQPVTLKCHLFVPGQVRQQRQVVRLERGFDVQTYRFPDGRQLLGRQLALRAVELGGPRTLHYTLTAEP